MYRAIERVARDIDDRHWNPYPSHMNPMACGFFFGIVFNRGIIARDIINQTVQSLHG